ncbi:MAG: FAD-binding oxidoreductase [Chloroflexi bacterium]|nr:FAD-binding oxidoreductase [Chloroflexota bacterium]
MNVPDTLTVNDISSYLNNVTALERDVPVVFKPTSEDEVRELVEYANANGVKLHPISRGKNWGLGSKLPVRDGTAIVDLSGMDRVLEVSEKGQYAIIEPGVTQAILANYLKQHHPNLLINATGSSANTSVMGNIIDRGDAVYAERAEDLLGMRGILGNGEPFQVGGFWTQQHTPTHYFRHGLGPDLRGLFTQSNFAIVTQAVVKLVPRPESIHLLWADIPQDAFADTVDALNRLCDQHVLLRNNTRIGYVNRFEDFVQSVGRDEGNVLEHVWNLFVVISGTESVARARLNETLDVLHRLVPETGTVDILNSENLFEKVPPLLHPTLSLLRGEPDSMSVRFIYRQFGAELPESDDDLDPDHIPFGMKAYLPIIPANGEDMVRAIDLIDEVSIEYGFPLQLQCDMYGRGLLTINFRRDDPDQTRRADACFHGLAARLSDAGLPPHRLSIDQMYLFPQLQPGLVDLVDQLKTVLDPNNIIAPGRYSR